jgi:hypothetical protein
MDPTDIRTVRPSGNEYEVDSLAACIQAALASWGRPVSYECVAGLAGAAFSPALSETEHCASWWMESCSDARIEFLGHALGFAVQRSPNHRTGRAAPESFVQGARRAVQQGEIVLCASRPCWAIVTAWSDGSPRPALAGPGASADRAEAGPQTPMYILRLAERSLTLCEALREAIRFGAAVAAGTHRAAGFAYGGRLYDAWLAQLGKEHFCPTCGEDGWKCAERTASRARDTQLAASAFLHQAKHLLPSLSGSNRVDKAALTYAVMAGRLAPYVAGTGLNRVWSSPVRRARYAQDVAEVRRLHHMAAEHLSLLACLV